VEQVLDGSIQVAAVAGSNDFLCKLREHPEKKSKIANSLAAKPFYITT
jgi:hypothetical protein